jgi:hypothetical protein
MAYPQSKISLVANVWVKQMLFEQAGDMNEGHDHLFDHQTLLAYGSVEVTVNSKSSCFNAPTIIYIRANQTHQIKALEAGTVCYCIHPIRDGERIEDIIDPSDIPDGYSQQQGLVEGVKATQYFKRAHELL